MMTVCRNSHKIHFCARQSQALYSQRIILFSLFSFLINGVAPLSLNVQQVDLLAPWGGFCFFPPLGGCLWMKTGTEEEADKRERGRRGRGVSQKKKKSEACSDVFQSQLQKGWALLVSLEGRRLS